MKTITLSQQKASRFRPFAAQHPPYWMNATKFCGKCNLFLHCFNKIDHKESLNVRNSGEASSLQHVVMAEANAWVCFVA